MNGSVSNNTISPKQVDKLLADFQNVVTKTKNVVDQESMSFFNTLGKAWAGEDAVNSAKGIADRINNYIIDNLSAGWNMFSFGIIELANFYARKAGKPIMAPRNIIFSRNINANAVKSEWEDGSYGFKQPGDIASLIVAFDSLNTTINTTATELSDSINRINAFGNLEVRRKLNEVAVSLSESMLSLVKDLRSEAFGIVTDAAHKYNISSEQIASCLPSGFSSYGLQTYFDAIDGLIVQ